MLSLEDVVAYLVTRNCSETLTIEKQTGLPEFLKEFCLREIGAKMDKMGPKTKVFTFS